MHLLQLKMRGLVRGDALPQFQAGGAADMARTVRDYTRSVRRYNVSVSQICFAWMIV